MSNLPRIGALFEAYASNNVAAVSNVMADGADLVFPEVYKLRLIPESLAD